MTFDEWYNGEYKMDFDFKHYMEVAWDAALRFAQQPQGEICAAWLPNEAACAYWGACNCAESPCRNTRKLSPSAAPVVRHCQPTIL